MIKKKFTSIAIFADSQIGLNLVNWINEKYKGDISILFTTQENELYYWAKKIGLNVHIYRNVGDYMELLKKYDLKIKIGFLIWWPLIIKEEIIRSSLNGFVNTHPSLLPFNRGKHPSFWALKEQCPYGVSLHKVDVGIDNGEIISQTSIEYNWEDNGETMYIKAKKEMQKLFKRQYPKLRVLNFKSFPQKLSQGSFHLASEINNASRLNLDEEMEIRKLLNLLRARTFSGFPGCSFVEDGIRYEIQIKIHKAEENGH